MIEAQSSPDVARAQWSARSRTDPRLFQGYLRPIYKNSDVVLEVECGTNKGDLYLSRLCQGSRGPCILFGDAWLTPNEFQYISGRENAKDWKRSIRHQGKSMKLLLNKGVLSVHPLMCGCVGCKDNTPVVSDIFVDFICIFRPSWLKIFLLNHNGDMNHWSVGSNCEALFRTSTCCGNRIGKPRLTLSLVNEWRYYWIPFFHIYLFPCWTLTSWTRMWCYQTVSTNLFMTWMVLTIVIIVFSPSFKDNDLLRKCTFNLPNVILI